MSLKPVALLAYVFAVTMLGTTLPSPLYPSYEHEFGFGQLTETVVFATYALGVLATLLLLGQTSDHVGRRPMLITAVCAAALSAAVFIAAESAHGTMGVALLLAGRVLSGLSGGLMTGTATAALADAMPAKGASLVAAMSQVTGLGLGPLLGGVLLVSVPHPLVTIYLVYLGLLALAALAITAIPETVQRSPSPLITPLPAAAIVRQVSATGIVGFAGFAVLGLFTGVCSAFLALAGIMSPAVTGLVIFSVFAASAVGQLASARIPQYPALVAGTAGLAVGITVVGWSLHATSVLLMELGGLIAGAGQGMSFRAALSAVASSSSPERRGEAASSFFVICYLGISLPIVGLGIATRAFNLPTAGQALAFLIGALTLATLVMIASGRVAGGQSQSPQRFPR